MQPRWRLQNAPLALKMLFRSGIGSTSSRCGDRCPIHAWRDARRRGSL